MSDKECIMWVLIVLFVVSGITISVIGICECIADCICGPKEEEDTTDVPQSDQ
jgi:hypothetical protein